MTTEQQSLYAELASYTLTHGGAEFIHQYVVDAFTAQHAHAGMKPIAITFALVGLYLHLERGFTGREVQRAHMRLAQKKREWPRFAIPEQRGTVTGGDVLAAPAGPARDAAIDRWCASVWEAYRDARPAVIALLAEYGIG